MNKRTLIIGASDNPERYAYQAAVMLQSYQHEIILLGKRNGEVRGIKIITGRPLLTDVNTVTLYINPSHQKDWYKYILDMKPSRVIFNPGTENAELEHLLRENNINTETACTLVMLSVGNY